MKRFVIGVAAASLLAVQLQDVAVAAPTPAYDVTCVVGGQTTVTWSHARLSQVTLEWFTAGSATAYATVPVPVTTRRPRGFVVSSAGTLPGITPATVHVSFRYRNGSGSDQVDAPCT
jgi:hypothetical protein